MSNPTPTKITHIMTGTPVGDVIDLGDEYNQVHVVAKGPCVVRFSLRAPGTAAPSAPLADPTAANGAEDSAGFEPLAINDTTDFEPDPSGQTKYRFGEVWELAGSAGLALISEVK